VRVVAIAGAIGDPAYAAAVGHGDGHGESAGDDEMAEGRGLGDGVGVDDECGGIGGREGAEQDGAFLEGLARGRSGIEQRSHAAVILAYGLGSETRRHGEKK
jgi:hypothetical protein